MAVGHGNGKLILFGEHSAVYGHPAVGIQLPKKVHVELTPLERGPSPQNWEFVGVSDSEREALARSVDALGRLFGPEVPAHRVEITGDLPFRVGFGSSAAFCAAMVRALDRGGTFSDHRRLWEAAHDLEHAFHGTPSGIDTGLSILPGAHAIYPAPPAVPRAEPVALPGAYLVVGAIERNSSTAALVRGIRDARDSDPGRVDATLSELAGIARSVIAGGYGTSNGAVWLGNQADAAQRLLVSLGVSTPQLDAALALLRRAGATGGKLSGAGGGGAFYGVFGKRIDAATAAEILRDWIAGRWHFTVSRPFVEVIAIG